jgi:RND family efflux transporter MFP subunit
MKARYLWILVGLALVGGVVYRVRAAKLKAETKEAPVADAALIRAEKTTKVSMPETIALTGTIRPRNEVDVFAKVGGRVDGVKAELGDRVKEGQTLVTIEHKEIGWQTKAADASVQVAKAGLDGAKQDLDRTENLFKGGAAPQAQLDGARLRYSLGQAQLAQAEAAAGLAHQNLDNAHVDSPISGTVIKKGVNMGAMVGPQAPLYTIQDVATLKLESSVDAADFSRVKKGMEAKVTVDALPGESFTGKIKVLAPSLDPATRRAAVEVEVDNVQGKLLPNMFAKVDLVVGQLQDVLAVPREAVLEAAGGAVVFRVKGDRVEAVRPKLGFGDAERITVLGGLAEGDLVAVSGVANLADGAKVKLAAAEAKAPAPKTGKEMNAP